MLAKSGRAYPAPIRTPILTMQTKTLTVRKNKALSQIREVLRLANYLEMTLAQDDGQPIEESTAIQLAEESARFRSNMEAISALYWEP